LQSYPEIKTMMEKIDEFGEKVGNERNRINNKDVPLGKRTNWNQVYFDRRSSKSPQREGRIDGRKIQKAVS